MTQEKKVTAKLNAFSYCFSFEKRISYYNGILI